jgi:hypothetical protein
VDVADAVGTGTGFGQTFFFFLVFLHFAAAAIV